MIPQTVDAGTDSRRKDAKWNFHRGWLSSLNASRRLKSTGWKNQTKESQRFEPNWELSLVNSGGEIKLVTILVPVEVICKTIYSIFDHLPQLIGQFSVMDQ